MIVPTVGRVVLFFAKGGMHLDPRRICVHDGEPHAAIVAYVIDDRLVNLSVFDANGVQFSEVGVPLRQPGDPEPKDGRYCQWMDYQIEKAEKEAAEGLAAFDAAIPAAEGEEEPAAK